MTVKYDYDVLYLGAGHGTFDGAVPLAQKGFKVGVIEADKVGGTCPNWGCNAKITLDAPVFVKHQQANMSALFDGELPTVNWKNNMKHKHEVIDSLPDMITGLVESVGIDLIHGFGQLVDGHTVAINDEEKTAEKIVIATGLHPNQLQIQGHEFAHDSQEFLALDDLPKQITIIGSGYIGMEFASIANAAGSEVTIMMSRDVVLRNFYQPYVELVVEQMKKDGIQFVENANVSAFKEVDNGYVVEYGDNQELKTDWILDATGRQPNVENIGLEKVGVDYDQSGIIVNDYLQTSVESIYASGDVISSSQPKLTPTAIFESTYLTQLFSRETSEKINFPAIPSVTFTTPRIAQIGVSVDEAKNNSDYQVVETDLTQSSWYYQIDQQPVAKRTLIFDENQQLVGATEVSQKADAVIDALVPVIELKPTKAQLGRMVHLFPSIASDVFASL